MSRIIELAGNNLAIKQNSFFKKGFFIKPRNRYNFFILSCIVTTSLVLSGCAVFGGQKVMHVPAKNYDATSDLAPNPEVRQVTEGQIKISIDGMTIEDAIGIAIARHPDIGRAVAVVAQSNAQVAIAKSAWYPTVQYGVNPGYTRYGGVGSVNNDNGTLSGSVGASQLVYDFGRTSSNIGATKATYEKQQHLLNDAIEQVGYMMASIFVELSAAQETIRAADRALQSLRETRQKISERVQAGLSDATDLNQADVALQRAKLDLLTAQNRYDSAAGRFAEITGIRPRRVAELNTTSNYISHLNGGKGNVDNTPAVLAATAEVRAAEERVRLAKANRFPSINVAVSQSNSTSNKNATNDSTFVGVQLSGSFSLGGKEKYQIEAQEAELRAARQTRDNDLMTTKTALGSAEIEGTGAKARMDNAHEMMGLSVSLRDLYWQQYTLNKRPLTDVINAERDTFLAESDYITAKADRLIASIKAYSTTGKFVAAIRSGVKYDG